ncbi:hypothetical protein GCM10028772_30300 [Nocardioides ultimimeridianus]
MSQHGEWTERGGGCGGVKHDLPKLPECQILRRRIAHAAVDFGDRADAEADRSFATDNNSPRCTAVRSEESADSDRWTGDNGSTTIREWPAQLANGVGGRHSA